MIRSRYTLPGGAFVTYRKIPGASSGAGRNGLVKSGMRKLRSLATAGALAVGVAGTGMTQTPVPARFDPARLVPYSDSLVTISTEPLTGWHRYRLERRGAGFRFTDEYVLHHRD